MACTFNLQTDLTTCDGTVSMAWTYDGYNATSPTGPFGAGGTTPPSIAGNDPFLDVTGWIGGYYAFTYNITEPGNTNSHQVVLHIGGTVNAGDDTSIETCVEDTQIIDLNAGLTGDTGGVWTVGTTGDTAPAAAWDGAGNVDLNEITEPGLYCFEYTVDIVSGGTAPTGFSFDGCADCADTSSHCINLVPPPFAGDDGIAILCESCGPFTPFNYLGSIPDIENGTWSVISGTNVPAPGTHDGQVTPTGVGTTVLQYQVTDVYGCTDEAELTVTVVPDPECGTAPLLLPNTENCGQTRVCINNSNEVRYAQYEVYFAGINHSSLGFVNFMIKYFDGPGIGGVIPGADQLIAEAVRQVLTDGGDDWKEIHVTITDKNPGPTPTPWEICYFITIVHVGDPGGCGINQTRQRQVNQTLGVDIDINAPYNCDQPCGSLTFQDRPGDVVLFNLALTEDECSAATINFADALEGEDPGGTWSCVTCPPSGGVDLAAGTYTPQPGDAGGPYTVRYTVVDDGVISECSGQCECFTDVQFAVNPCPSNPCNVSCSIDDSFSPSITAVASGCTNSPTFSWTYSADGISYGPVIGSAPTITITSDGYYKVRVSCADGIGCICEQVYQATVECDVTCAINPQFLGNQVTFLNAQVSGCNAAPVYAWSYSADGITYGPTISTASSLDIGSEDDPPGFYRLVVTCTDGNGCTCESVYEKVLPPCTIGCSINDSASPIITAVLSPNCSPSTFSWTYSTDGITYGSPISTTNQVDVSTLGAGFYKVVVNCTDQGGCSCQSVYEYTGGPCQINCTIDDTALPNLTANVTGCTGTITYNWTYSTDGITYGASIGTNQTVATTNDGYYRVVATCPDGSGCTCESVYQKQSPCAINCTIDSGALPNLTANVSGCVGSLTYSWSYSADGISYGPEIGNTQTQAVAADGFYRVQANCPDGLGCVCASVYEYIAFVPCGVNCGAIDDSAFPDITVTPTGCSGAVTYNWTFSNDGANYGASIGTGPTLTTTGNGYYRVEVSCPDGNGCTCQVVYQETAGTGGSCPHTNVVGVTCSGHPIITAVADNSGIISGIDTDTYEYSTDGENWRPGQSIDSTVRLQANVTCDRVWTGSEFQGVAIMRNMFIRAAGTDIDLDPPQEIEVQYGDGSTEFFYNVHFVNIQRSDAWYLANNNITIIAKYVLNNGYEIRRTSSFFASGVSTGNRLCNGNQGDGIYIQPDIPAYQDIYFRRTVSFTDNCPDVSKTTLCSQANQNPNCEVSCPNIDMVCAYRTTLPCIDAIYIQCLGTCPGATSDKFFLSDITRGTPLLQHGCPACELSGSGYYMRRIIEFGNGCPPFVYNEKCQQTCVCSPNNPGLSVSCNNSTGTASASRTGNTCYSSGDRIRVSINGAPEVAYTEGTNIPVPGGGTACFRRQVDHYSCYSQDNITQCCSVTLPGCSTSCSGIGLSGASQNVLTLNYTTTCTGTPSFQWYSSSNGTTYQPISGATSQSYTAPCPGAAAFYRATVTMSGCSNCNCGDCTATCSRGFACQQECTTITAFCGSANCEIISNYGSVPASCNTSGFPNRQWQYSSTGTGNWTNITGQTGSRLDISNRAQGYYRVAAICPTCTVYSNAVQKSSCAPCDPGTTCSCTGSSATISNPSSNNLTVSHNVTGSGGSLNIFWNEASGISCSGWGPNFGVNQTSISAPNCDRCLRVVVQYICEGVVECQAIDTHVFTCGSQPCGPLTCTIVENNQQTLSVLETGCSGAHTIQWSFTPNIINPAWTQVGTSLTHSPTQDGYYRAILTCPDGDTCTCQDIYQFISSADCAQNRIDVLWNYDKATCKLTLTKDYSQIVSPIFSETFEYRLGGLNPGDPYRSGWLPVPSSGVLQPIQGYDTEWRWTVKFNDNCPDVVRFEAVDLVPNCALVDIFLDESTSCATASYGFNQFFPRNVDASRSYTRISVNNNNPSNCNAYNIVDQGTYVQGNRDFVYKAKYELHIEHTNCCDDINQTLELIGRPTFSNVNVVGPLSDSGGCYYLVNYRACHFLRTDITFSHPVASTTTIQTLGAGLHDYQTKVYPNPGSQNGTINFQAQVNTCGGSDVFSRVLDCACAAPSVTLGNPSAAGGVITVPFSTTGIGAASEIRVTSNGLTCQCNSCTGARSCTFNPASNSGSFSFPAETTASGNNTFSIRVDNGCAIDTDSGTYSCPAPNIVDIALSNSFPNIGITANITGSPTTVTANNNGTPVTMTFVGSNNWAGITPFKNGNNVITVNASNRCGSDSDFDQVGCPLPTFVGVTTEQCTPSSGQAEPIAINVVSQFTNATSVRISLGSCVSQNMTQGPTGTWSFTGNCAQYGSNSYTLTATNVCGNRVVSRSFSTGCVCSPQSCDVQTQAGPGNCQQWRYVINTCAGNPWEVRFSGTLIASGTGSVTSAWITATASGTAEAFLFNGTSMASCDSASVTCTACTPPNWNPSAPTDNGTSVRYFINNVTGTTPITWSCITNTGTCQVLPGPGEIYLTPNCATLPPDDLIVASVTAQNACGQKTWQLEYPWPHCP